MCVCVCVCDDLLMLAPPLARNSAPDRITDKQQRNSRMCVDDEAEQSIDFNHCKWEVPIVANVRAVNY